MGLGVGMRVIQIGTRFLLEGDGNVQKSDYMIGAYNSINSQISLKTTELYILQKSQLYGTGTVHQ